MNRLMAKTIEKIVVSEGNKFLSLDKGFLESDLIYSQRRNPSLYVHIPFCKMLCPYCSFNRYPYKEELAKSYYKALKKELVLYKNKGFQFDEVYFGGGTPTVNLDLLVDFVEFLKSLFSITQISIEANPSDITKESVKRLKSIGVTRLSIGVQSFKDSVLKEMGRHSHTSREAQDNIKLASGHFKTVNIDFIFNFPSQTIEDIVSDVNFVNELGVDQATFYPLMPSPHKKTKIERKFNSIDTHREYSFYKKLLSCVGNSFTPSTCWCFSKGTHTIDEYIINHPEYIGIGAGSIGFIQDTFFVNTFSPENYISLLSDSKFPIVMSKKASKKESARYYMLTQLFGMKMNEKELKERYGSAINSELLALSATGMINKKNGVYHTTQSGMFYIGLMMKQFFTSLNGLREICISNKY
ncbi:MAG: coproporphyrinogen III oxidase family protein [Caldisericia bacterium]|nr:coproporphyrinogen III oxidase family protein [Caldisericia bacterium]